MPRLFETLAFSAVVAIVGVQSSFADDSGDNKHVAVFIDKQNDTDPQVNVKVNGEKYEFALPKLSEGESRTISTNDGKAVVLNRKDNQVTAKVGSETINLPNFDGKEHELIASFHGKPDGKNKVIAKTIKLDDSKPLQSSEAMKNTLLIGGAKLTEDEQKKVKEALLKAGINKEIKFTSGGNVVALLQDADFELSGDPDKDHNVVIVKNDGKQSEEKQIKIIRRTDKQEIEKK